MPIPAVYSEIIIGTVMFSIWTYLYRRNLLYGVVQQVVLGIAGANLGLVAVQQIWTYILTPLSMGKFELLLALIYGLLFFTIFFKPLANFSRTAILIGTGASVAIICTVFATQTFTLLRGYETYLASGNIGNIIAFFTFIIVTFFYTYSTRTGKLRTPIKALAVILIYIGFAARASNSLIMELQTMAGWMLQIGPLGTGYGIIIGAVIFLGILLDIAGVWDRLGLTKNQIEMEPTK